MLQDFIYFLWSTGIWPLTPETFEHHVLNGNLFTDIELIYYPVYNWTQRNSEGQVTVPWTANGFSTKNFRHLAMALTDMEAEVGCMNFPYISRDKLKTTKWKHGVVFHWNKEYRCNSFIGQINDNWFKADAPDDWQRINLGDCTHVYSAAQHEFMHALGFPHEQNRPDRDDFIDVDYLGLVDILRSTELDRKTKKRYLINNARIDQFKAPDGLSNDNFINYWKNSPLKFDLHSKMLYSSKMIVNAEGKSLMTLKNGSFFYDSARYSTIDVLKIQVKVIAFKSNLKLLSIFTVTRIIQVTN